MDLELTTIEIRALGSLVEKELTTPDQYPLSLAALTAACNQKTSRDPVMGVGEGEVREALDSLVRKALARERNPAGSRVPKYSHRLGDQLGLSFGFDRQDLALLAVLMLRGPQTPGELRARTARMCDFDGVGAVERALGALATQERGPYVQALAREPGRRETRYAQLFGGAPEQTGPPATAGPAREADDGGRIERLEREVASLRERLEGLEARLDRPADP